MINQACTKDVDVSFSLPGKLTVPCSALTSGINYNDIITLYSMELVGNDGYEVYDIEFPVDPNCSYMFLGLGYNTERIVKLIFYPDMNPESSSEDIQQGIKTTGNNYRIVFVHGEKSEGEKYYNYTMEPFTLPPMLLLIIRWC